MILSLFFNPSQGTTGITVRIDAFEISERRADSGFLLMLAQ